jgi:hypothetical protein
MVTKVISALSKVIMASIWWHHHGGSWVMTSLQISYSHLTSLSIHHIGITDCMKLKSTSLEYSLMA